MTFTRQPHLAEAAAYERDVREKNFPRLVKEGRVTRDDAEAELAAWRAIADIMERGETPREISWSTMHLYTSRCVQALDADVKRKEAEADADRLAKLLNRLALVDRIHQVIDRQKFLIDDTNALLRQRAARQAEAA